MGRRLVLLLLALNACQIAHDDAAAELDDTAAPPPPAPLPDAAPARDAAPAPDAALAVDILALDGTHLVSGYAIKKDYLFLWFFAAGHAPSTCALYPPDGITGTSLRLLLWKELAPGSPPKLDPTRDFSPGTYATALDYFIGEEVRRWSNDSLQRSAIGLRGTMRIATLTASMVTGAVDFASAEADASAAVVAGRFAVPLCQDGDPFP